MSNLNIISKIENLLYNNYLRYGIAIIIIFLNVYNFKNNRQKYSKKNCIDFLNIKISCKTFYYIYSLILLIADAIFLYYLDSILDFNLLPKYWWAVLVFLGFMMIVNSEDQIETVEKDGTFNPPPLSLSTSYHRNTFNMLTLLLLIISFGIEYNFKNKKALTKNLIYIRILSIIMVGIQYYYTINYASCKYNLPDSWKL